LLLGLCVVVGVDESKASAAPGDTLYRVNVGGNRITGTPAWAIDSKLNPSPYGVSTGSIYKTSATIDMTDPSIPAGTPAAMLQNHRYDSAGGSEMTWSFPTTPGSYEVRLYFAETTSTTAVAGGRVFSVQAEGKTKIQSLDVFSAAGAANKAIMRKFNITADTSLDLTFLTEVNRPMVAGIEIIQQAPQSILEIDPTSLTATVAAGSAVNHDLTMSNGGFAGAPALDVTGTSVSGTASSMLGVSGVPTALAVGASSNLTLSVNAAGKSPGTYTATVLVAHSGANASVAVPVTVNVVAPLVPGQVAYRVNVGGNKITATPNWQLDSKLNPATYWTSSGAIYKTSATIDMSDPSIPAGTPAALFQNHRYDYTGLPEMGLSFPTVPGDYEVRLFFAETVASKSSVGARTFDVQAEGQTVINDLDVFAAAGAGNKAIMRSFQVSADDKLDLTFLTQAYRPMIAGIEVLVAQPPAELTVSPTSVAFDDTNTGATATETVTVTNTAAAGSKSLTISGTSISGTDAAAFADTFNDAVPVVLAPGASTTFDVTFSPGSTGSKAASLAIANDGPGGAATVALSGTGTTGSTPGQVLFRVNAGGDQISGTPDWSGDPFNAPSPYINTVSNFFSTGTTIDTTDPSIPAGTPMAMFQSQRYDVGGGDEMSWSFPVAAGEYQVRMYFAETYAPNAVPGTRVFDVQSEGATVIEDLDVGAATGGVAFKGIMRSFTVTSDGSLDVSFLHQAENPMLSGIEVLTTDGSGVIEPSLASSPSSVSFPTTSVGDTSTETVTLTNTGAIGAGPLDITGVTVAGTDAGDFAVTFAAPVTLALGESTTVDVDFTPTATGSRAATLEVAHTGGNPTLSIPLSGVSPSGDGSTVLFRVNAGGPEVQGTPVWSADTQANPSPYVEPGTDAFDSGQTVDTSDLSLPAGTPAAIFADERYDGSDLQWHFPTGAGTYQVRLYFAETSGGLGSIGARQFDVAVEGSLVLDDFDQFSEAGGLNKGIMRSFTVNAASEAGDAQPDVDVAITAVVDIPTIKAIEIVIPAPVDPTAVGASPVSVAFGNTTIGQTQSRTVTLSHLGPLGADPVTITGVDIAGPWAEEFTEDYDQGNPVVLQPGGSTTVNVGHVPTTEGIDEVTLVVTTTGANSPIEIPMTGSGTYGPGGSGVSFGKSTISGLSGPASPPTSLKWGPDGRLYVAHLDGTIQVATIERSGPNSYAATDVETITSIRDLPNHDDNGSLNPGLTGRMVTGLEVVGTAANPKIYLVSSDPRISSPQSTEQDMDTNSGILSSLTWDGSSWVKRDLVRGLPRSKEQHSVQAVISDPSNGHLLLMSGGNTNEGAPSANFKNVPEYALTSAILDVDIATVEALAGPYDIPTLDDEDRPGVNDANDPFGGNVGKNQARLVPGGPVQIYASGFRNAYDAVFTPTGLYTIDNGGNSGWGGPPLNEGPSGVCTNAVNNAGDTIFDGLHHITAPGYYGGHPNPTRGSTANTFNVTNPQSPVATSDVKECDFIPADERGALVFFDASTNGIAQYTTGNFNGKLQGDLFAAGWNNVIHRVELNQDGTAAKAQELFTNVGGFVLDIVASKATDPFPGTLVVADFGTDEIFVFEPADYDGGTFVCTGADSALIDEDTDGYTNADEIDAGTDPCSGGDVPSDFDDDHISDVNDPDDDNDTILDVNDPFAVDPLNGLGTPIPVDLAWDSDSPNYGGILNIGVTGSMINGFTDWRSTFLTTNMTIIGAAGVVTVDQVPNGTSLGATNTQQYGLQFGFDARPANANTFEVVTSLPNPYGTGTTQAGHSWGVQMGTGGQDDYVKIVASGANGGELQVIKEVGGVATTMATVAMPMPGPTAVDLYLRVDPDTKMVQPQYRVWTAGVPGSRTDLGTPFSVPASWFDQGMAAGLIATSGGAPTPLTASWDYLKVLSSPGTIPAPLGASSLPSSTTSSSSSTVPSTTTTTTVGILPESRKTN
jgi:hypothetical protein